MRVLFFRRQFYTRRGGEREKGSGAGGKSEGSASRDEAVGREQGKGESVDVGAGMGTV